MREWLDALVALLLAPTCAACTTPLRYPTRGCVCPACWGAIVTQPEPWCDQCGCPLEPRLEPSTVSRCQHCATHCSLVDRARAIGPHAGALRSIVHALKYDNRRTLARPLAQLMRRAGTGLLLSADVAVPVPLHPMRQRERGFNQAADLAAHVGLPVLPALQRVRRTPTQTALPADERRTNVRGAFRATRHARRLAGATVLLVDDVRTTGATLEACAEALKEAGVTNVLALTAARVDL